MKFEITAAKDRHYICEIGRLFWKDNKQCYAADAVFREVKRRLAQQEDTADEKTAHCPYCGKALTRCKCDPDDAVCMCETVDLTKTVVHCGACGSSLNRTA